MNAGDITSTSESQRIIATSAQGPSDPAFRIRVELPARALSGHGLSVAMLPLFTNEQARSFRTAGPTAKVGTLARARRRLRRELGESSDTTSVLVQRQVDLAPSLALERAAVAGRRLIYDVDDAVWLSGRGTMGHPLGVLKRSAHKTRWLTERADQVIAGSEPLAEHLSCDNAAVTVVPPLIDPAAYEVRAHGDSNAVTLAWVGSSTTARYLERLVATLERFATQSARPVRLVVVGGRAPRVAGLEVVERVWTPDTERAALLEADIGLMPMPDTPWTRGKCAYKALQYMASGVPAIVDDVGISAVAVADAGWVATSEEQWLEGLHMLARDPDLRTRLGEVGRRRIEREYSLERWIPTLARLLRGG